MPGTECELSINVSYNHYDYYYYYFNFKSQMARILFPDHKDLSGQADAVCKTIKAPPFV